MANSYSPFKRNNCSFTHALCESHILSGEIDFDDFVGCQPIEAVNSCGLLGRLLECSGAMKQQICEDTPGLSLSAHCSLMLTVS